MSKTGTCKWYDQKKGFGIITVDSKEIFVHYSELESDDYLKEGDQVIVKDIIEIERNNRKKNSAVGVSRSDTSENRQRGRARSDAISMDTRESKPNKYKPNNRGDGTILCSDTDPTP